MKVDAKEIFYNVLADMDKDKIESTIVSKPSQVPSIIKEIYSRCMKLLNFQTDSVKFRIYGDLNEVLIHYFLSITMIPSERKVKYHNDLEIDLVIPTLKQLRSDPTRTLVISFGKNLDTNIINMQINRLLKVQPNKTNIWLIFGHHLELPDLCKGFTVFVQDDFVKEPFKPLSCIVDEINAFVETNKIRSFKIFRT